MDAKSQVFKNRRVFAYVDNGVPDGIQVDTEGNVYSGTGDGVTVCINIYPLRKRHLYITTGLEL